MRKATSTKEQLNKGGTHEVTLKPNTKSDFK
jgi:hypothetical protein